MAALLTARAQAQEDAILKPSHGFTSHSKQTEFRLHSNPISPKDRRTGSLRTASVCSSQSSAWRRWQRSCVQGEGHITQSTWRLPKNDLCHLHPPKSAPRRPLSLLDHSQKAKNDGPRFLFFYPHLVFLSYLLLSPFSFFVSLQLLF